jgi:hypothetical protein
MQININNFNPTSPKILKEEQQKLYDNYLQKAIKVIERKIRLSEIRKTYNFSFSYIDKETSTELDIQTATFEQQELLHHLAKIFEKVGWNTEIKSAPWSITLSEKE